MQRRRSGRLLKGLPEQKQSTRSKDKDENAMNLIARLSQKYLKNEKCNRTKQEQLPPRRNLRNRSAGSIGSFSNSLLDDSAGLKNTSVGQDTDDLYDFNLSEESLSLRLFSDTSKNSNASKSSVTSNGKKNKASGQQNTKSKTVKSKTPTDKKLSTSKVNKPAVSSGGKGKSNSGSKPEKKRPFWETFTNSKPKSNGRKRRKLNPDSSNKKTKTVPKLPPKPAVLRRQAVVAKTPNVSSYSEQQSLDSGIFSSPSFMLSPVPKSTSTPCNDISTNPSSSTPSILLAPVPDIQLYEEPSYDSFIEPDNSPMEKLQSPEKQAEKSALYSPIKYRVPLAEKNYANISFSGLTEREKEEKKKKKKESFKKVKGKYDKLAEEINKQFDEFDSYELSVEDE